MGADGFGKMLASKSQQLGMRTDGFLELSEARTAVCNMVLDGSGGLTGGVADMGIVQSFDSELVSRSDPRGYCVLIVMSDHRQTAPTQPRTSCC